MALDILSAVLMTLAAAPDTAKQTYKSVDQKGTVSYASVPQGQVIQDRISVIGPDPYFAKAAADLRLREAQRAEYEEREWQRRQQALMYLQTVPTFAAYDPYPPSWSYPSTYSYYPGYYGGGVYYRPGLIGGGTRPAYPSHPVARPPHVSHHASSGGSRSTGGGSRGGRGR